MELVAYIAEFLDGLFEFLSDPHTDVRTATLNCLDAFLAELVDLVTRHDNKLADFGKIIILIVGRMSSTGTCVLTKMK